MGARELLMDLGSVSSTVVRELVIKQKLVRVARGRETSMFKAHSTRGLSTSAVTEGITMQ